MVKVEAALAVKAAAALGESRIQMNSVRAGVVLVAKVGAGLAAKAVVVRAARVAAALGQSRLPISSAKAEVDLVERWAL